MRDWKSSLSLFPHFYSHLMSSSSSEYDSDSSSESEGLPSAPAPAPPPLAPAISKPPPKSLADLIKEAQAAKKDVSFDSARAEAVKGLHGGKGRKGNNAKGKAKKSVKLKKVCAVSLAVIAR